MSLSSPGYAVIKVQDRQPILITKGHVKTSSNRSHGQRLKKIIGMLEGLRDKYKYKAVIRERGFSRFRKTSQALFKVVGVCDAVFSDIDIIEIPPTTIKKQVAGSGKADKKKVAKAVRKRLDLTKKTKFATDDESDACAVCLAYLIKGGLID